MMLSIQLWYNNDYFVCMVVGVDDEKNVYVLEYVKERLTFNTQLNTIISYGRDKYPIGSKRGLIPLGTMRRG